jgi:hypothetical protein
MGLFSVRISFTHDFVLLCSPVLTGSKIGWFQPIRGDATRIHSSWCPGTWNGSVNSGDRSEQYHLLLNADNGAPPARPATCHVAGCVFVSFSASARLQMKVVGQRCYYYLKHPYRVYSCVHHALNLGVPPFSGSKKSNEPK